MRIENKYTNKINKIKISYNHLEITKRELLLWFHRCSCYADFLDELEEFCCMKLQKSKRGNIWNCYWYDLQPLLAGL